MRILYIVIVIQSYGQERKIIKKFKQNPTNVSFHELESILQAVGYIKVPVKGSHVKFKDWLTGENIIIPLHNNKCKDFYKKLVYKKIKNKLPD